MVWLNWKLLREDLESSAWGSQKDLMLHAKESELDLVSDEEPLVGF